MSLKLKNSNVLRVEKTQDPVILMAVWSIVLLSYDQDGVENKIFERRFKTIQEVMDFKTRYFEGLENGN